MKNFIAFICSFCICTISVSAVHAEGNWWDESPWLDPDRGFNWYPDPVKPKKETEEKIPEEKPKTIYEMTEIKDLQKEIERLRGIAVMNPTEQNIHVYLQAQNFMMDKASVFADQSRRVVWKNPDVNYSTKSPYASFASQNQRQRTLKKENDLIADLSKTHAILFFARSDCSFCHDQAPIVKEFSSKSHMPVLAISMDGGMIPGFDDAKPDNGISFKVTNGEGVRMVPALFLVEKKSQLAIPIGTGVIPVSEIGERIRILTTTKPGEEF